MFYLPVLKSEKAGVPGLDRGQKTAPLEVWSTSLIPEQAKWGYTGVLHQENGTLAMLFQYNNHSG